MGRDMWSEWLLHRRFGGDAQRIWEAFLHTAGNPKIPTLEEAMHQVLTPEETETFTAHLRPLVEAHQRVHRSAVAYLWAVK